MLSSTFRLTTKRLPWTSKSRNKARHRLVGARPLAPKNPPHWRRVSDLFLGAWNSTLVKQPDGIVILEAPISGLYTQGVIETARKRYPGMPLKAVLSTSDSWPHTGGVRAAVAEGLPV